MRGGKAKRGKRRLTFWVGLLGLLSGFAQAELPSGLPPVLTISPGPEVTPNFFSVAQAPDGQLHVGGSDGIHSFDGRRWQFMPMPNGDIVRSLVHDGNDRLYVGGYGQFGYARRQANGTREFIDLTPPEEELPGDNILADIWNLLITPEGVYFAGLHHLFLYDPEQGDIRTWYHPDRFGAVVHHNGRTKVQFREAGLKVFEQGDFELVEGGEELATQLYALLPLPEGGLLTLGRDGQWLRYEQGDLSPWAGSDVLPSSDAFSAWLVLPDDTLALAEPDGSLHLVDPISLRVRRFEVTYDYITDLGLAYDGGLLVQSDSRTVHVSWPSAWTQIGARSGLRGRVHRVVRWQDQWLAVTNAGVFRTYRMPAGQVAFERTDLTPFEAWDWLPMGDDSALLAESYNLIRVHGDEREPIGHDALYPRLLKKSRFEDGLLYVGTELGLAVVTRENESWSIEFEKRDFTGRVRSIAELDAGHLLAFIDDYGLVEIRFDAGFSDMKLWRRLDHDNGLETADGGMIHIFRLGDEDVFASTSAGFFEWHDGHFEQTGLSGLNALRRSSAPYQVKKGPDGTWWAHAPDHVLRKPPGEDWISEDLLVLDSGLINWLGFSADDRVLVGGTATVLTFDPSVTMRDLPPPQVALRGVILTTSDGSEQRLPLDGPDFAIPHDLVSMVFEYALPSFRRPELTRYQKRLLGFENHFDEWGAVTRITYSNLSPGDYEFVVRARDGQGHISESPPFAFRIASPWYMTIPARITWVVLALVLVTLSILGLFRWRLSRVNAEKERLTHMVDQRTAELARANRKLESMANIDGLTAVANRRCLDDVMAESWRRCADRGCELAILLIDVDHFKSYNDTHGHQAGDDILRLVAQILSSTLRRSEDTVGRYGGEEFMCILPGAPESMAVEVAEAMRKRVAERCEGITISIGLASCWPGSTNDPSDLVNRADEALYAAKQAGRDRVRRADS